MALALAVALSILPANLPTAARSRAQRVLGGMAEWLKAHAWKACIRATVSWVRIPLPPPPGRFEEIRRRPETSKNLNDIIDLSGT